MLLINKDKIITAQIKRPHVKIDEFDFEQTHGWQIVFTVGYNENYPINLVYDKNSEEECLKIINQLGLIEISNPPLTKEERLNNLEAWLIKNNAKKVGDKVMGGAGIITVIDRGKYAYEITVRPITPNHNVGLGYGQEVIINF